MASIVPETNANSNSWIPDEEISNCHQCNEYFTLVTRKHHCRACGYIFCANCSNQKLLIPKSLLLSAPTGTLAYSDPNIPHRVCITCANTLTTQQNDLRYQLSRANKETTINRDNNERYFNFPLSTSLHAEIKKAVYTLYNFTNDNALEGNDAIPRELLWGAKGIAFLTIAKVGFLVTGRIGSGLVISRLSDGTWSAPSALLISGIGWGLQVGGELTDVIIILMTDGAVDAFSSKAQVCLGSELAVSVGPLGRSAGTDFHAGEKGASACISYAHSKGLFLGLSLEASVIASRSDMNRSFYGMDVKPRVLLSGEFERPKAAEPLYQALNEVLSERNSVTNNEAQADAWNRPVYVTAHNSNDELVGAGIVNEETELKEFRGTANGTSENPVSEYGLRETDHGNSSDEDDDEHLNFRRNYEEIRF